MWASFVEKLKNLSTKAYLWIAVAVGAVVLYIVHLRKNVSDLSQQVAEDEANKNEEADLIKLKELDNEANSAEDNYNKLRDSYLSKPSAGGSEKETKS